MMLSFMSKPSPTEAVDWTARFRELSLTCDDERLRFFYESGAVNPDTPLSEVPFVALDFETTGLNPRKDDIVSVGLVPFDINRVRCREARHWIVNPRQPLAEESVVIHGITHSDITDAPDLKRIMEQLLEALAGRIVVVHYRYIERSFLNEALKARINEGILFPVVDTMELEARRHRTGRSIFWSRLMGRRPTSIRLADSRLRYNLPHYSQHHALTDAVATAELLQAQIANQYRPDTPISEIWL